MAQFNEHSLDWNLSVFYLYRSLIYLALPLLFLRLLWRSIRLPAYRERLLERLGFSSYRFDKSLWIHTVSVGETIAAIPLIEIILKENNTWPVMVTTMTPTGADRVSAAFGHLVKHAYLPYDTTGAIQRFLNRTNPQICLLMETELWPNLLHLCGKRRIPVYLLNARLSEKSARGYRRIVKMTKPMLQSLAGIAAQSNDDARRFISLGTFSDRVTVTGNLKFDLQISSQVLSKGFILRQELSQDRFIWIAASTHEGEEEMVLAAHETLQKKYPKALLILVPRHPDRFAAVTKRCRQSFKTICRSDQNAVNEGTGIYLGDTMGELLTLYAAADVAFVGGSLIPTGGHNLLEPAMLSKPILTGPHLFNFAEISQKLLTAKGLIKVQDGADLGDQLLQLIDDATLRHQLGLNAKQVVEANRGALEKQMNLVRAALKQVLSG